MSATKEMMSAMRDMRSELSLDMAGGRGLTNGRRWELRSQTWHRFGAWNVPSFSHVSVPNKDPIKTWDG